MFDLNSQTHQLLMDEPFFAAISRRVNKTASTAVPTAGVRVTPDGYYEMIYNPKFFETLSPKQRSGASNRKMTKKVSRETKTKVKVVVVMMIPIQVKVIQLGASPRA